MIRTIDTHTAGQPTRTVVGGLPLIPGATMAEKMLYLRDNEDSLRQFLMYEPRGNEIMSGAIITESINNQADIGVIFIEVGGYLPMCGHDTIGLTTALIETGYIKAQEPQTTITLDTPAGLVKVVAQVDQGSVINVTFKNVPAFVLAKDVEIELKEWGKIRLDVSYGGNVYAILNACELGLKIDKTNTTQIINAGKKICQAVNEQVKIQHPEKNFINKCTHVEFSTSPVHPAADLKNVVVIPPGAIDRSPCGTGTAAKIATLYQEKKLFKGDTFCHESIIGTIFTGKIVEETFVKNIPAVITEISGSAYITGFNNLVLDRDDPLPQGYYLGK